MGPNHHPGREHRLACMLWLYDSFNAQLVSDFLQKLADVLLHALNAILSRENKPLTGEHQV